MDAMTRGEAFIAEMQVMVDEFHKRGSATALPATDVDRMAAYGCIAVKLLGDRTYGYGTLHRVTASQFATAAHVTESLLISEIEDEFGPCTRIDGSDLHLFGDMTIPASTGPLPVENEEVSCVGYPGGASLIPEIRHGIYKFPNQQQEGTHWIITDGEPIGGMSGGGIYRGHITHEDLATAQSIGYKRAAGVIFNEGEPQHWGVVSFWGGV